MACFIHEKKEDKSKCVVCGKPICDDCSKFQEEYGACPSCLEKQANLIYSSAKRGLAYNILSLICAVLFLTLYIVDICLGKMDKTFIIVGAVILALLFPLSIYMFIRTLKRIKEYKHFLNKQ